MQKQHILKQLCWANLLMALVLLCSIALADNNPTPPPVDIKRSAEGVVYYTLPKGSAFHVVLQTPVHTAISKVNDPIEAILSSPIYLNDKILFNKSTRLFGHVERAELPIQGRNAVLEVRFDSIKLSSGDSVPITAHVRTETPDHAWGGELTPGSIPKVALQSVFGIGQYGKTVYTGPRLMGTHIEFLPGSYWIILLDKPLTVVGQSEE